MRHFCSALEVDLLADRVLDPPLRSPLVVRASGPHLLPAGRPCASLGAVAMAPIAARADPRQSVATGAVEQAVALGHRRTPHPALDKAHRLGQDHLGSSGYAVLCAMPQEVRGCRSGPPLLQQSALVTTTAADSSAIFGKRGRSPIPWSCMAAAPPSGGGPSGRKGSRYRYRGSG
jgi:hypothetical protein